jgi:2-oxoglutarate ferredoxin oxidoreductase subunit alpha
MILGAAAAGARVFTTSSSPGISLMSEGISYIVGMQCPAVFVNIMRGGPGLGGILPSQADYLQATKGVGHGDCRLLVLAPAGVQEAVEMVMLAFPLAEKYRNPVMILGDGLIGQMMEPVDFSEAYKTEPTDKNDWAVNGMDTRNSSRRNLLRSLYLDPEELNRQNLILKAKYEQMEREDIRFEAYNTDGDYSGLIVSYGTMSRVCRTAIDQLKAAGVEIGMIRPQTVFPFPEDAIQKAAAKDGCRWVASIEMSMGQMLEDVERSVGGERSVFWYGKCGGEVPTPEEVIDFVKSLG